MLVPEPFRYQITEFDRLAFERFVAKDHPLAIAEREICWEEFRPVLEQYYAAKMGQPAIDPVVILKLEFLRYQYNLSDQQVIDRAKSDLGFRYFLQVGFGFRMPDPSSLSRFRGRLGAQGFGQVFDKLVAQARQAGLVKDRLRLKDASHVIASIAIPTTLALVAEIRNRLLAAMKPFDAEAVAGQEIEVELLRTRTAGERDEARLTARVTHLRELVAMAQMLPVPEDAATNPAWQKLLQTRELAEKILRDRDHPEDGRKTLSVTDPEARRGKHGEWYDGYVTDILLDPDSSLITQVHVLEAGGDEAKDAVEMVRNEEAVHGNDIENLSIDGAGFNGEMLRALDEMGVTTFVPPKTVPASTRFSADEFTLNAENTAVVCPTGQLSKYCQRDEERHSTIFRFTRAVCDACPLVKQCVAKLGQGLFGRSVQKNDFEPEYQRARERAQTHAFATVRKEHPAVERKLNEIMNHHDGRHARYRGLHKVPSCERQAFHQAANCPASGLRITLRLSYPTRTKKRQKIHKQGNFFHYHTRHSKTPRRKNNFQRQY
jgi:transposase